MQKQATEITQNKCRKNERGAALVTVLMISFLLLVVVSALLLETSMNAKNVTDATSEEQAYYAAESGIQTVLNVLRGNTVLPDSLRIDSSKPATDVANKIDYFKAIKLATSNLSSDTSTEPRLSRWLTYDTNYPDRVTILGSTSSGTQIPYSPNTGFAYKIKVENPDNTNNTISYSTVGNINKEGTSKTWGALTISYVSKTVNNLDVSSGVNSTDFGKFVFVGVGTIPTRTRFAINVNMTQPYVATKTIRGYIEAGDVGLTQSATSVRIFYDSKVFIVSGSSITLDSGVDISETVPLADGTIRVGYQVTPSIPNTVISGTMSAPEPTRLLITSTGFGPRGAQKRLEAVIQKNYFNGLSAPSPLVLIGPPSTTSPTTNFVFNPGTSNGTTYSGKDVLLTAFLPPIGVTNDTNVDSVTTGLTHPPPNKYNGKVYGTVSNVNDEMPFWLQSPANLDKALSELRDVAKASGRYYPVGATQPSDYGNNSNATGITYIEGDLTFSGSGGGILVVTGGLNFNGGFNFNGLIIVTGTGGITRSGGGSGVLQGNMIVAPYLTSNLAKGFLAPVYDISGGGGSEIVYNSNNVANGLTALSNFVKGVAEK